MSDYSFNPAPTRRVAIIGGNRIPFARSNTVYAHDSNQDLLVAALQGLVDRYNLHGLRLGEFAAGARVAWSVPPSHIVLHRRDRPSRGERESAATM